MDDKTIVFTLKDGERVSIPQGNPVNPGDRILVIPTSDGKFVTMGNNPVNPGDRVIVLTTNQGEKVTMNVSPPTNDNDWVWAHYIPYTEHNYAVDDRSAHSNNIRAVSIPGSTITIPPCRALRASISLDVFTIPCLKFKMDLRHSGILTSQTACITTLGDVIGGGSFENFLGNLYEIPVYGRTATKVFGSDAYGSPEMPEGHFSIKVPKGNLGTLEQPQANPEFPIEPNMFDFYLFPPYYFYGEIDIDLFIRESEVLDNPDLYELI